MARKKNGNDKGKPEESAHMPGKEVEKRLLEAENEEDIKAIHKVLKLEGVPDGTITATITKLKKRGSLIFQTAVTETGATQVKPSPVEVILRDMKLPVIADGDSRVFDAGVSYGMRALIAGIRMAQELSQMGISQASPVIRMAQELRAGAGQSAREAGEVAAETALAGAIGIMSEKRSEKVDIATVPNPMAGIMARAMEPALTKALGGMMGMFGGQPAQGSGQSQTDQSSASSLPSGWVDESGK